LIFRVRNVTVQLRHSRKAILSLTFPLWLMQPSMSEIRWCPRRFKLFCSRLARSRLCGCVLC
jgi:hypothetical protein